MDEFDRVLSVAYNLAYCAAVAAMLLLVFPGVRTRLGAVAQQQAYAWRHGRYLERQAPARRIIEALHREDLPQERPA